MNSPRIYFHMATITRDGQQLILAFGGETTGFSLLNSVEQFNPSNNTWTLEPTTMQEERYGFGAFVLSKELICPN